MSVGDGCNSYKDHALILLGSRDKDCVDACLQCQRVRVIVPEVEGYKGLILKFNNSAIG